MELLPDWVRDTSLAWILFFPALLDLVATVFWIPRIYTTSPVLFRRTLAFSDPTIGLDLEALVNRFRKPSPSLVFRRETREVVLFRERWFNFGFNYTPIIRGVLEVDRLGQSVEVRGHMSWTVIGLALVCVVASPNPVIPMAFGAVICGVIFEIQRVRYLEVAEFVAQGPRADSEPVVGD